MSCFSEDYCWHEERRTDCTIGASRHQDVVEVDCHTGRRRLTRKRWHSRAPEGHGKFAPFMMVMELESTEVRMLQ